MSCVRRRWREADQDRKAMWELLVLLKQTTEIQDYCYAYRNSQARMYVILQQSSVNILYHESECYRTHVITRECVGKQSS